MEPDPGAGFPGRAPKAYFLIKFFLETQYLEPDPGAGFPSRAPKACFLMEFLFKTQYQVVLSEAQKNRDPVCVYLPGKALYLSCQFLGVRSTTTTP